MSGILRTDVLGVVGGLGPLASAEFMRLLAVLTPAERDSDHIPVIACACPHMPEFDRRILEGAGETPAPYLRSRVWLLRGSGARAIAVPCDVAHAWYEDMTAGLGIPIIHIADAVREELGTATGPIGLLAGRASVTAGIYQSRLGLPCLTLSEDDARSLVAPALASVKRNRPAEARPYLLRAIDGLFASGAVTVVLGATEMGLAFGDERLPQRCVDANRALAKACVRWALGQRKV